MTSAPMEPNGSPSSAEEDVVAGDLGVGGSADDGGEGGVMAVSRH